MIDPIPYLLLPQSPNQVDVGGSAGGEPARNESDGGDNEPHDRERERIVGFNAVEKRAEQTRQSDRSQHAANDADHRDSGTLSKSDQQLHRETRRTQGFAPDLLQSSGHLDGHRWIRFPERSLYRNGDIGRIADGSNHQVLGERIDLPQGVVQLGLSCSRQIVSTAVAEDPSRCSAESERRAVSASASVRASALSRDSFGALGGALVLWKLCRQAPRPNLRHSSQIARMDRGVV